MTKSVNRASPFPEELDVVEDADRVDNDRASDNNVHGPSDDHRKRHKRQPNSSDSGKICASNSGKKSAGGEGKHETWGNGYVRAWLEKLAKEIFDEVRKPLGKILSYCLLFAIFCVPIIIALVFSRFLMDYILCTIPVVRWAARCPGQETPGWSYPALPWNFSTIGTVACRMAPIQYLNLSICADSITTPFSPSIKPEFTNSLAQISQLSGQGLVLSQSFFTSVDNMGKLRHVIRDSDLPDSELFLESYNKLASLVPEILDELADYLAKSGTVVGLFKARCESLLRKLDRIEDNLNGISLFRILMFGNGPAAAYNKAYKDYLAFLTENIEQVTDLRTRSRKLKNYFADANANFKGMDDFIYRNLDQRERAIGEKEVAILGSILYKKAISSLKATYQPVKDAEQYRDKLSELIGHMDGAVRSIHAHLGELKDNAEKFEIRKPFGDSFEAVEGLRYFVQTILFSLERVEEGVGSLHSRPPARQAVARIGS